MSLTSYRAAPPRAGGGDRIGSRGNRRVKPALPARRCFASPCAPGWRARLPEAAAGVDWKTWRRPTLPCLETQYHGRWGISRPSSGWDRVQAPRHDHQVVQSTPGADLSTAGCQGQLSGVSLPGMDMRFWCCAVPARGRAPPHALGRSSRRTARRAGEARVDPRALSPLMLDACKLTPAWG